MKGNNLEFRVYDFKPNPVPLKAVEHISSAQRNVRGFCWEGPARCKGAGELATKDLVDPQKHFVFRRCSY